MFILVRSGSGMGHLDVLEIVPSVYTSLLISHYSLGPTSRFLSRSFVMVSCRNTSKRIGCILGVSLTGGSCLGTTVGLSVSQIEPKFR